MENFKQERLVLITGGGRGIGKNICQAFKQKGYRVIASHYGHKIDHEEFYQEIGVKLYEWDVSDYQSCLDHAKQIEAEYGPIEILINNAGITKDGFLHKSIDNKAWQDVININLGGCFNMCRAVIESMRTLNFGRIISMASINALAGCMGQTNYSASKAGIIGFSKSLALESANKNITVNVISPGYIQTEMTEIIPDDIKKKIISNIPCGRFGQPSEIARIALFLAHNDAGFITGATINVNGGGYMQ